MPPDKWLADLDFTVGFLGAHLSMLHRIAEAAAECVEEGGDADDVGEAVYAASGFAGCLERYRLAQFKRDFSEIAWQLERDEMTP